MISRRALLGGASVAPLALLSRQQPAGAVGGEVEAPAPPTRGRIALTFDDGPSQITPLLLQRLRAKNVRATFFLQGSHVLRYPLLARRIAAEGHVIGNHGWSHRRFAELSPAAARAEIVRTNDVIRWVTGKRPVLFRYPFGEETEAGNAAIRDLGMWGGVLWHWQTAPGDYTCPGAQGVADYVVVNAVDQALILLHDGNEVVDCGPSQLAYVGSAIDRLRQAGYDFGIVAPADGPSPVNGHSWVKVVPWN